MRTQLLCPPVGLWSPKRVAVKHRRRGFSVKGADALANPCKVRAAGRNGGGGARETGQAAAAAAGANPAARGCGGRSGRQALELALLGQAAQRAALELAHALGGETHPLRDLAQR